MSVWCEHFSSYKPAEWGWPSGNQCRQPAEYEGPVNGMNVTVCVKHSALYPARWKRIDGEAA